MFERHTKTIWRDRNPNMRKAISEAWDKELWSRMIDLKQVGSSLSSANLSLAAIAGWAYFHDRASLGLVILHLVGYFAFASVCWVKTMQQAEAELEEFAKITDERVSDVHCTDDSLIVDLMDGRTISVPLAWYPRLHGATAAQRAKWERCGGGFGIHWPDLDEDLSTEGLLRGAPAPKAA